MCRFTPHRRTLPSQLTHLRSRRGYVAFAFSLFRRLALLYMLTHAGMQANKPEGTTAAPGVLVNSTHKRKKKRRVRRGGRKYAETAFTSCCHYSFPTHLPLSSLPPTLYAAARPSSALISATRRCSCATAAASTFFFPYIFAASLCAMC
jgi:hypothetical protein